MIMTARHSLGFWLLDTGKYHEQHIISLDDPHFTLPCALHKLKPRDG